MSVLTEQQRRQVLTRVSSIIKTKFVSPHDNGVDSSALLTRSEDQIIRAASVEDFEREMNALLQQLGASHTGFFHGRKPRAAGRIAIAATFMRASLADGERWVFQDVHPGGIAANSGIVPGDVLLTIDSTEIAPPDSPAFSLGRSYDLTVRKANGSTAKLRVDIPGSKERKRPIIVPDRVVTASKLSDGAGLVRVSMFPGVLGMDVARDINTAIAELACSRLIIDLRGNTGGGLGCLRIMSQLCSDRRGVGYSADRKAMASGQDKSRLPVFDRIPNSKLGVFPLILRFGLAGRAVSLFTEACGTKPHHGRVALLVNEHSASATEMAAAFASEYKLATLVGTKTAGKVVGASSFKVGHDYRIAIPVAAYFTWNDKSLEGSGVLPDRNIPLSVEGLWNGEDTQLREAQIVIARQ